MKKEKNTGVQQAVVRLRHFDHSFHQYRGLQCELLVDMKNKYQYSI